MRKIGSSSVRGTGAYKYLNKPPKAFADHVASSGRPAQRLIAGKDISSRVEAVAGRNGGFSGMVSGNKRGR